MDSIKNYILLATLLVLKSNSMFAGAGPATNQKFPLFVYNCSMTFLSKIGVKNNELKLPVGANPNTDYYGKFSDSFSDPYWQGSFQILPGRLFGRTPSGGEVDLGQILYPESHNASWRKNAYKLESVGQFNLGGKRFHIVEQNSKAYFGHVGKYQYIGVYEEGRPEPVYYMFSKFKINSSTVNFQIFKSEESVQLVIPGDQYTNVIDIRGSIASKLEAKGFRRSKDGWIPNQILPKLNQAGNDLFIYNYFIEGENRLSIIGTGITNGPVIKSKNKDNLLVIGPIWQQGSPLKEDSDFFKDRFIVLDSSTGEIGQQFSVNSPTLYHNKTSLIEHSQSMFGLLSKSSVLYDRLSVIEKDGSHYLMGIRGRGRTQSGYVFDRDIHEDPGLAFFVSDLSTGNQVASYKVDGVRYFIDKNDRSVDPNDLQEMFPNLDFERFFFKSDGSLGYRTEQLEYLGDI